MKKATIFVAIWLGLIGLICFCIMWVPCKITPIMCEGDLSMPCWWWLVVGVLSLKPALLISWWRDTSRKQGGGEK